MVSGRMRRPAPGISYEIEREGAPATLEEEVHEDQRERQGEKVGAGLRPLNQLAEDEVSQQQNCAHAVILEDAEAQSQVVWAIRDVARAAAGELGGPR
jgi:hypothetical protein